METSFYAQLTVGDVVVVKTKNEKLEGEVYAFDQGTSLLVLQQKGSTQTEASFHIINTSQITELSHTSKGSGPPEDEVLPEVDEARSEAREQRAVELALAESKKIGENVTKQGQQLFDALSKTLPCHWDDKVKTTIVVLDEIYISEPYGVDNCVSTHPDDVVAMDRVKMILSNLST